MTVAITSSPSSIAQEKKFIEQTIVQFVKGTTNRDAYNMNYLLHENFQAVVSSVEPSMISKSDYMKMLAWKKLGGIDQAVEIISLEVSDYTAAAKVKIATNGDMQIVFYHLYMESNGSWQVLHVLPYRSEKV